MAKQTVVEQFVAAMEQARRPSAFSCDGRIDADVGLKVEGLGPVTLPLRPATSRKLAELATRAPYGKRTETILDTSVRDTWQIAADAVQLSDSFRLAIEVAAAEVAGALRLDHDRLEVELYKLLIYRKGGFFLTHRDSEKRRGMVATMIVVLPSRFGGGELVVEHGGQRKQYRFDVARSQSMAQYAAFFADCNHEVKKVTSGVRVCLAFNLRLKTRRDRQSETASPSPPKLLHAVEDWLRHREGDPLVFALEHQYTASGLKPNLLKGVDKELYRQLAAVAQDANCRLHLGQVSRHLCQSADDGYFGYGWRGRGGWSGNYDDLNVGEVHEDEIVIDGWKDAKGRNVSMGKLTCESSQLVSATPIENWIPTQQDYEGYTGNAGNTLERWYHKSALVLWSDSQHFDVVAQMGLASAVEQLLAMRSKLAELDDEDLEAACDDCQALAEAIIRYWPNRRYERRAEDRDSQPWLAEFARELLRFDDPDLVGEFLRTLAQRDPVFPLDRLLPTAIKRMGAAAIVPHLEELIGGELQPDEYGEVPVKGLAERDASWLCKLSQASRSDLTSETLHHMLDMAIAKLQRHANKLQGQNAFRGNSPTSAWLPLCQAAISAAGARQLDSLLQLTDTCPKVFDLRTFQVMAAKKLSAWADKHAAERPRALQDWIESIKQRLRAETQVEPAPPSDFQRYDDTGCSCPHCRQLAEFLRDREQETTRIAAREDRRGHLEQVIRGRELDVTATLDRSSRPYALRLTKTTGAYQRTLKQYRTDLQLLASLESTIDL